MATKQEKIGFAHMLRDVLTASINRGQFPMAVIGLVVMIALICMPGQDVSKLMFHVMDKLEQGSLLGYALFVAALWGWYMHVRRLRLQVESAMDTRKRAPR